jgi:hypothetical protein
MPENTRTRRQPASGGGNPRSYLPKCRGLIGSPLVSYYPTRGIADGGENGGLHPPYACWVYRILQERRRSQHLPIAGEHVPLLGK